MTEHWVSWNKDQINEVLTLIYCSDSFGNSEIVGCFEQLALKGEGYRIGSHLSLRIVIAPCSALYLMPFRVTYIFCENKN